MWGTPAAIFMNGAVTVAAAAVAAIALLRGAVPRIGDKAGGGAAGHSTEAALAAAARTTVPSAD